MSAVLFYRREIEASIAAPKSHVAQSYDLLTCALWRAAVASGQIDKGMALCSRRPALVRAASWIPLLLFVGHYMRNDLAAARYHAGQLTSTTHVFGQWPGADCAV